MTQPVAVIGIGEDGLAGLRPEAQAALAAAQVLVGGERHHRLLPEHPADRVVFRREPARLAEEVARLADAGRNVAVLASGDPLFFGIGAWLARRLGAERVRVYPNLGSVQLAFARLGESWHDADVVSAHGRPLQPVVERGLTSHKLAVLLDAEHTAARVAEALLAGGVEGDARAWVLERLGAPSEAVRQASLATAVGWQSDPLSVLVVVRDPARVRGPRPRLGLPDEAFAQMRGQITKAEVRVLSVTRLGLRSGDTLWDIGAGAGSVSVEAAGLCRPGLVYAIERDPEQCACLATNLARFEASNVRIVADQAPAALAELPDPDAVFVGGSGGQLVRVLRTVVQRLQPGGRLVVNLATLQGLHVATGCLEAAGLAYDLVQLSVARGTAVGRATRLAALNPVFVVSATQP